MKMISCNECGDIISEVVDTCDNCGTPNSEKPGSKIILLSAVTLALFVLLFGMKFMLT